MAKTKKSTAKAQPAKKIKKEIKKKVSKVQKKSISLKSTKKVAAVKTNKLKSSIKAKPVVKKTIKAKVVQPAKKVQKKVVSKPVLKSKIVKPVKKAQSKISKPKVQIKSKPVAKKSVIKKTEIKKPVTKKIEVKKSVVKIVPAKTVNPTAKSSKVQSIKTKTPEIKGRNRYADEELHEFKKIIIDKLDQARKDLELLTEAYTNTGGNSTDDTSPTFKVLEEGSQVLSKEENSQLAGRLNKFIQNLEAALVRIENKTYGICRVTGKLIPKERLRSVPHATLSIEAKLGQKN